MEAKTESYVLTPEAVKEHVRVIRAIEKPEQLAKVMEEFHQLAPQLEAILGAFATKLAQLQTPPIVHQVRDPSEAIANAIALATHTLHDMINAISERREEREKRETAERLHLVELALAASCGRLADYPFGKKTETEAEVRIV